MAKRAPKNQGNLFDPEAGGFWTEKKVKAELPHVQVQLKKNVVAKGITAGRLNDACTVWIYHYMNPTLREANGQTLKFSWAAVVNSLNANHPLKV